MITEIKKEISAKPFSLGKKDEYAIKQTAKILIVDDSSANIQVLANILKKENFELFTALDGKQGLMIAENKLPDLILLDVMMPEMNGFETCEHLKSNKKTKGIPVIFVTADTETESVLNGLQLGAVDYITKPYNPRELLARINNHLSFKTGSEFVNALFESRHHSFIVLNKAMEIQHFNDIANEREYEFSQLKFKKDANYLDHLPESSRTSFKTKVEGVFKGKTFSFEKNHLVKNKEVWFSYLMEPIYNKQGEIIACLLRGSDITEKKEYVLRANEYHRKMKEIYTEAQESLSYASYIQKSIYPTATAFNKQFHDNFVLFQSKEKVSGDFYWIHRTETKDIFVLGDCTGHGVPGALLTTIGVVLLERVVNFNKVYSPDNILSEMDILLTETLKQKEEGVKVGLEMGVCVFDRKNKILEYAGARRSLMMAHGEDTFEIKANRCELGGGGEAKFFKKHTLHMAKGTSYYLYSDGIVDQIGGPQQKKFMKKNLEKNIALVNNKPMTQQKAYFKKMIREWVGMNEQTDDILLVGIKI